MLANIITIIRVILAMLSIYMINSNSVNLTLTGILLIPVTMMLDMLDGYVARKSHCLSQYGSLYDILADRIISFSYFIFFSSVNISSFWPVLIIVMRGLILDNIRCIAFKHNIQAFSNNLYNSHPIPKFLTQSRFSRGFYNTLKMLLFIALAIQYCYQSLPPLLITYSIWLTVFWSILRALPVLHMGYKLIQHPSPTITTK